MKISTETMSVERRVGLEQAITYIAKAGFDAFDMSLTNIMIEDDATELLIFNKNHPMAGTHYLQYVRHLKQIAEDNGIICNQSHAPFPADEPIVRDRLKWALECTAELGAEICVIHPICRVDMQRNVEMYHELLPFAKEYGVKIATENMWDWNLKEDHAFPTNCSRHDDFLAHIEAVNDPDFVACVDLGHAEMDGLDTSADLMIRTLGKHVQALHIHDIDGHNDNHQIPFSLNIDYGPILKALKDVGYNGYFTLESVNYLRLNPQIDTLTGLKDMAAAARRLADMFDAL
ncbi:MAG: sugar phosphate isomerase/epimerase [Ruminococcaceae bacterium]|nr:sugar phosphate isomerase/epimerase [Oscillospiraceae bacterium]